MNLAHLDLVHSILLGLALASATGLRAFLPLLALALAAHFGHLPLNGQFAWLKSDTALAVLGIAAVAELLADKVPAVDHALDAIQTVIRPLAGALAVAGTQAHADPVTAAVVGLALGAPLAGAVHTVKGGTRLASTATTAGFANPILSVGEDVAAVGLSILAFVAPVFAVLLAALALWAGWRIWRRVRRGRAAKAAASS